MEARLCTFWIINQAGQGKYSLLQWFNQFPPYHPFFPHLLRWDEMRRGEMQELSNKFLKTKVIMIALRTSNFDSIGFNIYVNIQRGSKFFCLVILYIIDRTKTKFQCFIAIKFIWRKFYNSAFYLGVFSNQMNELCTVHQILVIFRQFFVVSFWTVHSASAKRNTTGMKCYRMIMIINFL